MSQFAERIYVCLVDDMISAIAKNKSEYNEKTRHLFHSKYELHLVVDICHSQIAAIYLQGSVSNSRTCLYDPGVLDRIKQILIDEFICKQYPSVVLSGWTTDPEIKSAIRVAAQTFHGVPESVCK